MMAILGPETIIGVDIDAIVGDMIKGHRVTNVVIPLTCDLYMSVGGVQNSKAASFTNNGQRSK